MKLKNLLYRIPRPLKACLCAVLVLALAAVYYIALGCPTTFRQEFRRAERVHMVGPSEIVDIIDGEYREFEKMIVGETEYGICFFGSYVVNYVPKPGGTTEYYLKYLEKTDDLMIAVAPNTSSFEWTWSGSARALPVYVFTDEPEAVRAEIELTVTGEYSHFYHDNPEKDPIQHPLNRTLQAEANRSESGIFRFWLEADDQPGLAAMQYISNAIGGNAHCIETLFSPSAIQATVRLYDAQNTLIREETQILHTASNE